LRPRTCGLGCRSSPWLLSSKKTGTWIIVQGLGFLVLNWISRPEFGTYLGAVTDIKDGKICGKRGGRLDALVRDGPARFENWHAIYVRCVRVEG
jgi:hypothetical protein